jgi:hypothetical protein
VGDEKDKPAGLRRVPVPEPLGGFGIMGGGGGMLGSMMSGMADALRAQQESTAQAVDSARKSPLAGGNEVTFEFTGAGTLDVAHKLGRKWTRWIVVSKSATGDVWEPAQTDATKLLSLEASAAMTIRVVVS